jgi:hypothetical protein
VYQNRLGPSGGIYYPNFVPCFIVLYLNNLKCSAVNKIQRFSSKENPKVQKQTDNLKGSAVNKIQRFSSKQIHNPGHNLKGSAVKKIQRFSSNR